MVPEQLYLFWKLQVNGLQPYVVCSDQHEDFKVHPYCTLLVSVCLSFFWLANIPLWMEGVWCGHSPADAAVNVRVCLSPCFRFFGLYT